MLLSLQLVGLLLFQSQLGAIKTPARRSLRHNRDQGFNPNLVRLRRGYAVRVMANQLLLFQSQLGAIKTR